MTHHPSVLTGGIKCEKERAHHLQSFWEGFRLANSDHKVFSEHGASLSRCLPLMWHGDEGRGKRRGNTVVVSCETPFGVTTSLQKKRCRDDCGCNPPAVTKAKYPRVQRRLTDKQKESLRVQTTTMKGHTLLHHYPLFIVPSSIHHEYPGATIELLKILAEDFRQLFFEGIEAHGRNYTVAIIAAKGDLKWFKKIALERSWENQGVVRNLACCHECGAGVDNVPFEDVVPDVPIWGPTRWTSRPWSINQPAMIRVPFCDAAPEKQYKRDIFHNTKIGIFRDLAGSALCYLVVKNYFGAVGDVSEKLTNAHGAFALYCKTVCKCPALRTFSKSLMMFPRLDCYPFANTKGSDTMLLLSWLAVQSQGFENTVLDQSHLPMLRTIRATCNAATAIFKNLNRHKLWLERTCAMELHANMSRFVVGYVRMASMCLNDQYNGFAIKPKLHLFKHELLELHEALERGDEVIYNCLLHGCEPSEDAMGKVCRLSRRLDSRCIGLRVLSCCLLKSAILNRKFEENRSLWSIFGCLDLVSCWLKKTRVNVIWDELGGWKQVSWSCGDLPMDEYLILFLLMFIFCSYLRGGNNTVIHLDILDFSSTSELPIHSYNNIWNGDNFLKRP